MKRAAQMTKMPKESTLARRAATWVEAVLPEIPNTSVNHAEVIHRLRTAAKQARALTRLLRPALGKARSHALNLRLRDAARALAGARARTVARELLGRLQRKHRGQLRAAVQTALRELPVEPRAASVSGDNTPQMFDARATLLATAQSFRCLRNGAAFGREEAVDEMRDSYRRSRRQMRRAGAAGQATDFHEWRKLVKRLFYQLEFAGVTGHPSGRKLIAQFNELQQRLGSAQDAHQVAELLAKDDTRPGGADGRRVAVELEKRSAKLRTRSLRLGRKVFTRKPRDFARCLRRWLRELS